MTVSQLKEIMKYHLRSFNDENVRITDNTVHNEVLDTNDMFGSVNSKKLYKNFIRYTIKKNNFEDKNWPGKWMELSVSELANTLISGGRDD